MLITDVQSAEIIKYASNAFLATRISFIKLIADLCEATGADVVQVAKAMGCDSRIGPAFLNAGLGFGARASRRISSALIHTMRQNGLEPTLLDPSMTSTAPA
jgi:UDPglucose 6-dehydrogenase